MESCYNSYLECTGCTSRFHFEHPGQSHFYTNSNTNSQAFSKENYPRSDITGLFTYCDSSAVFVSTSTCWCLHCKSASLVEFLPDAAVYIQAKALRKLHSRENQDWYYRNLLTKGDEEFAFHSQQMMARTAPPRCIRCGHSDYILIEEGERNTGIVNACCENSSLEYYPPPNLGSAISRPEIDCYHALTGELNWLHIHERAVISCMTDDSCKVDLREAAYALVCYREKEAFAILQTIANENRTPAMTALGTLYLFGIGVEADGELAIHYLRKALKAGDGLAAMNLSRLYWSGLAGIKADEEKTRSYLNTAREMGIYIR